MKHLNDPEHLSEECLQLHCVEGYAEPSLEEINVLQAGACVNQAD